MPCTRHRVFLATLIVACKYLNDSAPKNKHWAEYATGMFDPVEINLMEKQLLFLLDFDLRFEEKDAIAHFAPFMPRLSANAKETRAAAINCAKARVQAHVSLPLTPPDEVPPAPRSVVSAPLSGVQSLVKKLSSTYLSVSNASSRPRPVSRSSSSSTLDGSSTSEESDSGWLTSDSGSCSPTSTEASSVCSSDTEDNSKTLGPNDIQPIIPPGSLFPQRQGRKVSSTSTCTVKSDSTVATTVEVRKPTINLRLSPKGNRGSPFRRSGSHLHYQSQSNSAPNGLSTVPRSTLAAPPSMGFLSRMWGSSNKIQAQDQRDTLSDADQSEARGPGALRKLTHSKSGILKSDA